MKQGHNTEQSTTTEMDLFSPAEAFTRSLKTRDDNTFGERFKKETRRAVVTFDELRFISTCSSSSPTCNADPCNYEEMASENFKVGVCISKYLVKKDLSLIADMHGWTVAKDKQYSFYNRFEEPKRGCKYIDGNLSSGFFLRLVIKALVKVSYVPKRFTKKI